ncbi:hypothetical protein L1887_47102 [Cichorium endivia]|nr:hypothetical protein L1887_47102 [Cichorium endivia]
MSAHAQSISPALYLCRTAVSLALPQMRARHATRALEPCPLVAGGAGSGFAFSPEAEVELLHACQVRAAGTGASDGLGLAVLQLEQLGDAVPGGAFGELARALLVQLGLGLLVGRNVLLLLGVVFGVELVDVLLGLRDGFRLLAFALGIALGDRVLLRLAPQSHRLSLLSGLLVAVRVARLCGCRRSRCSWRRRTHQVILKQKRLSQYEPPPSGPERALAGGTHGIVVVAGAVGVGCCAVVKFGEVLFKLAHLIVDGLGRSCRRGLGSVVDVVKAKAAGRRSVGRCGCGKAVVIERREGGCGALKVVGRSGTSSSTRGAKQVCIAGKHTGSLALARQEVGSRVRGLGLAKVERHVGRS